MDLTSAMVPEHDLSVTSQAQPGGTLCTVLMKPVSPCGLHTDTCDLESHVPVVLPSASPYVTWVLCGLLSPQVPSACL